MKNKMAKKGNKKYRVALGTVTDRAYAIRHNLSIGYQCIVPRKGGCSYPYSSEKQDKKHEVTLYMKRMPNGHEIMQTYSSATIAEREHHLALSAA